MMAEKPILAGPILAGVVGSPIAHSLSPLIHSTWAARAGVNGYYIPIDIPGDYDAFARAMDALRRLGFAGVNVTIPHKEHALRYASTAHPFAQNVGAANTLTFRDDDVHAHNTDGAGFATALSPHLVKKEKYRILVLGAGGAARAVARISRHLLRDGNKGPNEVIIANRTLDRARDVAGLANGRAVSWDERAGALGGVDVLVNTTSLGMTGQPALEIDLADLPKQAVVFDIIYTPLETPLMKAARTRGNPVIGGLEMLMHQAVHGFDLWFGAAAPVSTPAPAIVDDDLRSRLVAALTKRAAS